MNFPVVNALVAARQLVPTPASRVLPSPAVPLKATPSLLGAASLPPRRPAIVPKIPNPALKSPLPPQAFRPPLLALVMGAPPIIHFPPQRCILLFPRRRGLVVLQGKRIPPRVCLLGFALLIILPTGVLSLMLLATDITRESRMSPRPPHLIRFRLLTWQWEMCTRRLFGRLQVYGHSSLYFRVSPKGSKRKRNPS